MTPSAPIGSAALVRPPLGPALTPARGARSCILVQPRAPSPGCYWSLQCPALFLHLLTLGILDSSWTWLLSIRRLPPVTSLFRCSFSPAMYHGVAPGYDHTHCQDFLLFETPLLLLLTDRYQETEFLVRQEVQQSEVWNANMKHSE